MSEHEVQNKSGNAERRSKMVDEVIVQIVTRGGSITEVTEALVGVGLNSEEAVRPMWSLIDRGLIVVDEGYKLRLTQLGEVFVLENGVSSGVITELADAVVDHKRRMAILKQLFLTSVQDS